MGYEKKKRKYACPKKVCHMPKRHVKNRKDAYSKKICHMLTTHVKKSV